MCIRDRCGRLDEFKDVAPSRARGSKPRLNPRNLTSCRRAFTGARIETVSGLGKKLGTSQSRLHGRADRNTGKPCGGLFGTRRAFTGARIETFARSEVPRRRHVAPSRARGSKLWASVAFRGAAVVAPSRARGSKRGADGAGDAVKRSRLHGRADRNFVFRVSVAGLPVAPSRARGSKLLQRT